MRKTKKKRGEQSGYLNGPGTFSRCVTPFGRHFWSFFRSGTQGRRDRDKSKQEQKYREQKRETQGNTGKQEGDKNLQTEALSKEQNAARQAIPPDSKVKGSIDTTFVNVGQQNTIKIALSKEHAFLNLEKTQGPNEMSLDRTELTFKWTPTNENIGYNKLKYNITYNTSKEFEEYFENGIQKLKQKEELVIQEQTHIIFVKCYCSTFNIFLKLYIANIDKLVIFISFYK